MVYQKMRYAEYLSRFIELRTAGRRAPVVAESIWQLRVAQSACMAERYLRVTFKE
jgi:hypothetical protein